MKKKDKKVYIDNNKGIDGRINNTHPMWHQETIAQQDNIKENQLEQIREITIMH